MCWIQLEPVMLIGEDLDRVDMHRAIWAVIRAAESCAFRELSVSKSLWADAKKVDGYMARRHGCHGGGSQRSGTFFANTGPLIRGHGREGQKQNSAP